MCPKEIRNVHISKGIYASPPISMVKGSDKRKNESFDDCSGSCVINLFEHI